MITQTRWLNEQENRAWRAYLDMSKRLDAYLNRSLSRRTGLSLSDYEVMVALSEAPDDRLRAFELGAQLQWEKSRLSHHLTRMEKRGLVERQSCESDGRGLFVGLTAEGRTAIENAAPSHVADVREKMIDLLTPAELDTLTALAARVTDAFDRTDDAALCED